MFQVPICGATTKLLFLPTTRETGGGPQTESCRATEHTSIQRVRYAEWERETQRGRKGRGNIFSLSTVRSEASQAKNSTREEVNASVYFPNGCESWEQLINNGGCWSGLAIAEVNFRH